MTPPEGTVFDGGKVLIDPYSRGNNETLWNREKASVPGDNLETSMRSVVIDASGSRWENNSHITAEKVSEMPGIGEKLSGKSRLQELNETIIYELHVGGFTRSPTSGSGSGYIFRDYRKKFHISKILASLL